MRSRLKIVLKVALVCLGIIWALPVTLVNLFVHVLPLWALRAYDFVGVRSLALVWAVRPKNKLPRHVKWVAKIWKGWGANAVGNVIVFRNDPDSWQSSRMFIHEFEHVKQSMRLGVFHPLIYALNYIAIFAIDNADPYADNPFEIAARRAAGQPIDVNMFKERIAKRLK